MGFSDGDGGLPLRYDLRCAISFTLDEIDSVVRDLVSFVNSESVSSTFFDIRDSGRLLLFLVVDIKWR